MTNKHRFLETKKKQDLVPEEPSDGPGNNKKAEGNQSGSSGAGSQAAGSPAATIDSTGGSSPAGASSSATSTNNSNPGPNNTNKPNTPNLPPIVTSRSNTPDIVLGEYFMISSSAFRNPNKFPPIKTENGSIISIQTDDRYFRINDAHNKPDNEDKLPSNKFFWFRLSGINLYYTTTKTDVNILGSIAIESIDSVVSTGIDASSEYITTCFTVKDFTNTKWKICGLDEPTVIHWYCQIKSFLKEEDLILCPVIDPKVTIIEKYVNITQPILLIPLPSKKCNQNWNYQKEGSDWECDCSEGREQAPIDLPSTKDAIESDVRPLFQYDKVEKLSNLATLDGIIKSINIFIRYIFKSPRK
jgi:hypothetical protein